jgi:biopolymer transport protein ExbD
MQKVEFRRNHTVGRRGSMLGRSAVLLAIAVFGIFILLLTAFYKKTEQPVNKVIIVTFLSDGYYIVGGDTTNYDNFASVLKEKIVAQKDKQTELNIRIPKDKNMGEINDILQIANAFEGVDLKLSTE